MIFNSFKFIVVFPLIFLLYYVIPAKYKRARNLFLLIVSYALYVSWKPVFALVLLTVTVVTYWGGLVFDVRCKKEEVREILPSQRKRLMWLFALLGVLPLLFFKYYNFLNESISEGMAAIGMQFALPGLNWAVPVGISFFTFQAVGYLLDVYYGRIKAERNFLDYALFISFFPSILSGPINKASLVLPQIKNLRTYFDYGKAVAGLKMILWGMFMKVVVADRVGLYVDTVLPGYMNYTGVTCFIASLFYTIQIYADFAGYSLMAVGLGKTLGFDLINNFRRPYFSVSITDFWRRWHISLSRWLKDYVYIPLGGSRCSKLRNYWNIFVTFLVSGIWHGANWTFIVWGILHGIVITFLIVTIAWTIFRSPSIGETFGYFARYLSLSGKLIAEGSTLVYIIMALIPVVLYEVMTEFFPAMFNKLYGKQWLRWCAYLAVFTMMMLIGVFDGSSFIYVSF